MIAYDEDPECYVAPQVIDLAWGWGLILLLLASGWGVFDLATRSDDLQGPGAWPTATPSSATAVPEQNIGIAWDLENAGLKDGAYLDATSVSSHLKRLRDGEVDQPALETYAGDLQRLNEVTAEWGRRSQPHSGTCGILSWKMATSRNTRW